jgi:hypothetical protein
MGMDRGCSTSRWALSPSFVVSRQTSTESGAWALRMSNTNYWDTAASVVHLPLEQQLARTTGHLWADAEAWAVYLKYSGMSALPVLLGSRGAAWLFLDSDSDWCTYDQVRLWHRYAKLNRFWTAVDQPEAVDQTALSPRGLHFDLVHGVPQGQSERVTVPTAFAIALEHAMRPVDNATAGDPNFGTGRTAKIIRQVLDAIVAERLQTITAAKVRRMLVNRAKIALQRVLGVERQDYADTADAPGDPHSPDHRRSRAPNHSQTFWSSVVCGELAIA